MKLAARLQCLTTISFARTRAKQRSQWLGGAAVKAMVSTAEFLKEQGRITEVKGDYKAFVTDVYLKKAAGK